MGEAAAGSLSFLQGQHTKGGRKYVKKVQNPEDSEYIAVAGDAGSQLFPFRNADPFGGERYGASSYPAESGFLLPALRPDTGCL